MDNQTIIKLAVLKQPNPVNSNGDKVLDLLSNTINLSQLNQSEKDILYECLKERQESGIVKYNTYLKTYNDHDALVDAFQEVLDSIFYLQQEYTEHKDSYIEFLITVQICTALDIIKALDTKYNRQ